MAAANITAWRRFAMLSGTNQRLLVEAALQLVAVRISFALVPFATLRRLIDPWEHASARRPGMDERDAAARVSWAMGAVARRLPGRMTCLVQALAAHALLRRRGFHSTLRIGVAEHEGAGEITAHAWLECGGEIVVGGLDDLGRYAVLSEAARR
jgi:hypothetical protein